MKILIAIKLLIIAILISQTYCSTIYSQQKFESHIIDDYIKKIDSLNNVALKNIQKTKPKTDPMKTLVEEIRLNDLKHIAALMFKASDLNHIALMDSANAEYLRNKKSDNQGLSTINRFSTEYKLQKEMKDLISPIAYALTRVAYFLCIHVENVKTVIPTQEEMVHAETVVVDAIIDKVYKGTGEYQVGDHVQFYFYKAWHKELHTFEVGKKYFVPLEPRGSSSSTIHDIVALVPYLDDSNGYYPIINNYLIDKYNYFGFGERVQYNEFNEKFINKIKEVESW
jgi:hypothetical protein